MRIPLAFIMACLLAAIVPLLPADVREPSSGTLPDWPAEFEGRQLHPLELTDREKKFTDGFPGRIARFTDGKHEIIMRVTDRATRKLHPAAECFRATGYSIKPLPIYSDASGARWGCFDATRNGNTLRTREIVRDAEFRTWADASAWYWAALMHRAKPPYIAITVTGKVKAQ